MDEFEWGRRRTGILMISARGWPAHKSHKSRRFRVYSSRPATSLLPHVGGLDVCAAF